MHGVERNRATCRSGGVVADASTLSGMVGSVLRSSWFLSNAHRVETFFLNGIPTHGFMPFAGSFGTRRRPTSQYLAHSEKGWEFVVGSACCVLRNRGYAADIDAFGSRIDAGTRMQIARQVDLQFKQIGGVDASAAVAVPITR